MRHIILVMFFDTWIVISFLSYLVAGLDIHKYENIRVCTMYFSMRLHFILIQSIVLLNL